MLTKEKILSRVDCIFKTLETTNESTFELGDDYYVRLVKISGEIDSYIDTPKGVYPLSKRSKNVIEKILITDFEIDEN